MRFLLATLRFTWFRVLYTAGSLSLGMACWAVMLGLSGLLNVNYYAMVMWMLAGWALCHIAGTLEDEA